jgi:murein DD-endopeptidase MepM/ murein hydrolase activator NlpD
MCIRDSLSITPARLAGQRFKFYWHSEDGHGFNGIATLKPDGTIAGIASPNESTWTIDENGRLVFKHADGRISTRYVKAALVEGILCFEGPFTFREGITHRLIQTDAAPFESALSITSEQAERIAYSNQRFVYLDPAEEFEFQLRDGRTRTIRLDSVQEHTDDVIGLVRSATVKLAIDNQPVHLRCAPYVMPVELQGLKILVDTTSGWMKLPKRVQLSIWDATDPIVDTDRFCFPLPQYRLFSLGTQAYNEPVHLGHRDGDPAGQRFYHNYGVDLAGFEGRQKVVSSIEGDVVRVDRQDGTLCIQDDRGFILVYGHLDSILSDIAVGSRVRLGQWVGMLGKRGSSGNFSHLHVGAYLSEEAMLVEQMNRNLNIYPWLVEAYRKSAGTCLIAVARPHQIARVGQQIVLDGSSTVNAGSAAVSYRWEFHDGSQSHGAVAKKVYDKPGCYMAALKAIREDGQTDIDFCRIRVFSQGDAEPFVPTLFVTTIPAGHARAGQPVNFRIWPQGGNVDSIRIDFGDGSDLSEYQPYAATTHFFAKPGSYTVTASGRYEGMPVTQMTRIIVAE